MEVCQRKEKKNGKKNVKKNYTDDNVYKSHISISTFDWWRNMWEEIIEILSMKICIWYYCYFISMMLILTKLYFAVFTGYKMGELRVIDW